MTETAALIIVATIGGAFSVLAAVFGYLGSRRVNTGNGITAGAYLRKINHALANLSAKLDHHIHDAESHTLEGAQVIVYHPQDCDICDARDAIEHRERSS